LELHPSLTESPPPPSPLGFCDVVAQDGAQRHKALDEKMERLRDSVQFLREMLPGMSVSTWAAAAAEEEEGEGHWPPGGSSPAAPPIAARQRSTQGQRRTPGSATRLRRAKRSQLLSKISGMRKGGGAEPSSSTSS